MGAQQDQLGGGEPGLHHRFLVREVRSITASAACATGVPGTAVIATVGACPQPVQQLHISVVVPDRDSTTTRS